MVVYLFKNVFELLSTILISIISESVNNFNRPLRSNLSFIKLTSQVLLAVLAANTRR